MLENISPATHEKLPEIINLLENDGLQQWESAAKNNSIEEIKDFGDHIRQIGDNYSLEILCAYGQKLVSLASLFDIENMEAALAFYPQLVEQIKSRR